MKIQQKSFYTYFPFGSFDETIFSYKKLNFIDFKKFNQNVYVEVVNKSFYASLIKFQTFLVYFISR